MSTYGEGEYVEGGKKIQGEIVLGQHKLYLRGPQGDWAPTYVPLEKIIRVRQTLAGVQVHVKLTQVERYIALIKGKRPMIKGLARDLASRRGFKKRLLRNEWVESR